MSRCRQLRLTTLLDPAGLALQGPVEHRLPTNILSSDEILKKIVGLTVEAFPFSDFRPRPIQSDALKLVSKSSSVSFCAHARLVLLTSIQSISREACYLTVKISTVEALFAFIREIKRYPGLRASVKALYIRQALCRFYPDKVTELVLLLNNIQCIDIAVYRQGFHLIASHLARTLSMGKFHIIIGEDERDVDCYFNPTDWQVFQNVESLSLSADKARQNYHQEDRLFPFYGLEPAGAKVIPRAGQRLTSLNFYANFWNNYDNVFAFLDIYRWVSFVLTRQSLTTYLYSLGSVSRLRLDVCGTCLSLAVRKGVLAYFPMLTTLIIGPTVRRCSTINSVLFTDKSALIF